MLEERHLTELRDKFSTLTDEELLNLLIFERQTYSEQAIDVADSIARKRQLEYKIPDTADEVRREHPWYINVGFILMCIAAIGFEIYLSSVSDRSSAWVAGAVARHAIILYLGFKSVPFSRFSLIFVILTAIALVVGTVAGLIFSLIILGLMYLLKNSISKAVNLTDKNSKFD